MTAKEKEIVAAILTMIVVFAHYLFDFYVDFNAGVYSGADALSLLARRMLWMIGAGIAIQIVLVIVLNIAQGIMTGKAAPQDLVDERDRMIELQTEHWFSWIAVFGFIGGLVSFAYGGAPVLALNIMLAAWVISTLTAAIVQLVLSRRGY